MAESRDGLSRPIDIAALYARRRLGILGIYQDQRDLDRALASPIQRPSATSPVGHGRDSFGTQRVQGWRGRNIYRTSATGRENRPVGRVRRGAGNGKARSSNRYLPSWYPRTPLRDVTAIVRAYERRRERLGVNRDEEVESLIPDGVGDSVSSSVVAHLEHSNTMKTPKPSIAMNRCPPSVRKVSTILLAVTNKPSEDTEFLTPQKKLLNSIDTVEKEVMQELQKLKRTASSKRAERQKKVKTLMSLR